MSKFKHDLLLRLIKLVDAVLMTIPFALCWYLYYSDRTASPFDEKGNLIVVLLFLVLFIIFGRIYDAFMMSIQQISEIVYAQFLAVAVSDLIIYVVICLLSKGLTNLLPGIAALVGQIILAFLWAYLAHHGYYATFPAKRTAIIYDVRRGFEKLIGKYGLDGKYDVVLTLCAEDCLKDLSVLDGIETVFASGIHSHDRNIILKYCIEHSINMFVIPRIGDVIMSGARHMHMFHLPMLTVSRYAKTNFVLFSYAGKFLKEQSVRVGVINNIWLFIPLGTGLYRWFQKRWVLLIPFVMSVAIETTQYITGLGIAEFDDVFGNTMGGWIGVLVAYIIMMWRSEKVSHRPQSYSIL